MNKQKTIRLQDHFQLVSGQVAVHDYLFNEMNVLPEYKVGAKVVLVEYRHVDNGNHAYDLVFGADDGIPGNSNPNIRKLHGWRGTTNNIAMYAHGLRMITKIRELKDGTVAVTVGRDLTLDQ